MRRVLLSIVIASTLIGFGWSVGRAQAPAPDFELVIDAPAGATTVTCKRGCSLAWVERGTAAVRTRKRDFAFSCGGPGVDRCPSGAVGGWLER